MQHLPYNLCLHEFTNFLTDKVLPVLCLPANFLLHGAGAEAHRQMVLDHLPRDPGKVRRFLGEHVRVFPEEGDERAFLFCRKVGADGDRVAPVITQ